MYVDNALDTVGGYKRWHLTFFILLSLSCIFPICLQTLAIIFIGWVPPYHCYVQQDQMLNESLPRDENGKYKQCLMFVNSSIDNSTTECQNGYHYSSDGYTTIVTEFDLVCKDDFLSELSQFLYIVGTAVADMIGSYMADRFGRKKVHIIAHMCLVVVGSAVAFAPNYASFVVIRCISGMISVIAIHSGITLLLELFGTKMRAFAGIGLEFVWVFMYLMPCLLAYFVKNWRHFQLIGSIVSFIWIIYIWILPESVPWLVARHRYTEAEDILLKMAKLNGMKNIPRISLTRNITGVNDDQTDQTTISLTREQAVDTNSTKEDSSKGRSVPLSDLFCDSKLRCHLLCVNVFWFANTMIYYAMLLSTPSLGPNRFVSYVVMGIVEVPAYVVCILVVDRFGRKIPQLVFFIIAGVSLGATAFVPNETANGTDLKPLIFTLVMIGKFGITGSFAIMVLYARELFPTTLRSSSLAWGGIGGNVGSMIAPGLSYLARHVFWLPNIIYAATAITAGILTLPLPETMNKPLPVTTEDVYKIFYKKTWLKIKKEEDCDEFSNINSPKS